MAEGKIETYIGFCVRAGKLTYGGESIQRLRGGVYALLVASKAAKNTMKTAAKCAEKFSCPIVMCPDGFEKAVNKTGCRIVAVRDRSLAKAICDNLNGGYRIYSEAVNG